MGFITRTLEGGEDGEGPKMGRRAFLAGSAGLLAGCGSSGAGPGTSQRTDNPTESPTNQPPTQGKTETSTETATDTPSEETNTDTASDTPTDKQDETATATDTPVDQRVYASETDVDFSKEVEEHVQGYAEYGTDEIDYNEEASKQEKVKELSVKAAQVGGASNAGNAEIGTSNEVAQAALHTELDDFDLENEDIALECRAYDRGQQSFLIIGFEDEDGNYHLDGLECNGDMTETDDYHENLLESEWFDDHPVKSMILDTSIYIDNFDNVEEGAYNTDATREQFEELVLGSRDLDIGPMPSGEIPYEQAGEPFEDMNPLKFVREIGKLARHYEEKSGVEGFKWGYDQERDEFYGAEEIHKWGRTNPLGDVREDVENSTPTQTVP